MKTKYIVWVKEAGIWEPNGDGPMTEKEATRIAREIKQDTRVPAMVLPAGTLPEWEGEKA